MDITRANYDDKTLLEYIELFKITFPNAKKYTIEYLKWLYIENPEGQVIGFNAYDSNRLVAHYACIPVKFMVKGTIQKGLLSLNTATHPQYWGKGLFTYLANKTYDFAKQEGYNFVYGVSNANSTYGFINKLGFQLVKQLDVNIGIGTHIFDFDQIKDFSIFYHIWDKNSLIWRCSNPSNMIKVSRRKYYNLYSAHAYQFFNVIAYLPLITSEITSEIEEKKPFFNLFNLFIGALPNCEKNFRFFIDIPNFLKPSPLNLIYKNLTNDNQKLDQNEIFITFMDFDAF